MQRRSQSAFAFLAFPLVILFVFTLLPTIAGLGLSLFRWNGGTDLTFTGLENFKQLARDDLFRHALWNTLVFTALTVPPLVLISFLLAVGVHAKWFVGRAIVRTLIFMPTVVSIVAIGFVWRWLLAKDAGLVNFVLMKMNLIDAPIDWMQHPGHWPMTWIIIVSIWRGIGFCMVLYLAALTQISDALYEAASLDGASRFAALRHITWPQVAPMTVFLLITQVIGALQVFDIVFVMTGQAEGPNTTVLNLHIYRQYTYGQFGYASAIGVVIFVITLVVTLQQLAIVRRRAAT